ncbi:MAG TPA: multidrug efflux SMR transporter [Gemmataceae bacterium]|nr:multidrug efflux SMR transporter [Gemmataceae bacterium]
MITTDLCLLLVAIACEVAATSLLKASDGLTKFRPIIGVAAGYLTAVFLLAVILKRLPVGPVYAAWAGLGTASTAVIGRMAFKDRLPVGGWLGIGCVTAGVVLLGLNIPRP